MAETSTYSTVSANGDPHVRRPPDDESPTAESERWYSVTEAARFFSRSNQWMYDRFRNGKFTYQDGSPILPVMVGDGPRPRRRLNLYLLREITFSCYRSGVVKWQERNVILRRLAEAKFEGTLFDPDEE